MPLRETVVSLALLVPLVLPDLLVPLDPLGLLERLVTVERMYVTKLFFCLKILPCKRHTVDIYNNSLCF